MSGFEAYLTKHCITQDDFAKRAGVAQATISRIAKGSARPSLDLAVRIERLTEGAVPATSWVAEPTESTPAEPAPEPRSDAA